MLHSFLLCCLVLTRIKGNIIGRNQTMLCSQKTAKTHPSPWASPTTSTHPRSFYLYTHQTCRATGGTLGLLLKATRRLPFCNISLHRSAAAAALFTVGLILHIVVSSQSHSRIPTGPAALKIHNSLLTIMAVNHSTPRLT